VQTGRDALELIACGARDVALGTVLFSDPAAPARVRAELAAAATDGGVVDLDDAIGLALGSEKRPEKIRKVPA
jgi:dihydroorotate dehydrogenase (NAD+) catalytic subunit